MLPLQLLGFAFNLFESIKQVTASAISRVFSSNGVSVNINLLQQKWSESQKSFRESLFPKQWQTTFKPKRKSKSKSDKKPSVCLLFSWCLMSFSLFSIHVIRYIPTQHIFITKYIKQAKVGRRNIFLTLQAALSAR